jgi:hypothetical protein
MRPGRGSAATHGCSIRCSNRTRPVQNPLRPSGTPLSGQGVLQHVILSSPIDLILAHLEVADGPNMLDVGIFAGTV